MATQARGLRNNNPGNIVRDGTSWQGMAAIQSDPRFVVFVSAEYGIRALAKTLLTYQSAHGCSTLRKIIERWAPVSENDTVAYIAAVAKELGVGADDVIDVDRLAVMLPLVEAICRHENGSMPYSQDQLLAGLHLAGIADAMPPEPAPAFTAAPQVQSAMKSKTVWAGFLAAFVPLVLSAGPFLLKHLGMDEVTANQTAEALAGLLATVSGPLAVVGRANANIKPLG